MANKANDFIIGEQEDNWYELNDNSVYLKGPITKERTDEIIRVILTLDKDVQTLNLYIDSPGGDLYAAFGLIAIMRATPIHINTIAIGMCASAALMIAMAGDHRFVDKYCSIMSHIFSTANTQMSKPEDIKVWQKSVDMNQRMMIDHYIDCTELPEQKILAKLLHESADAYLTAKEAIEFNLFDDIFTTIKDL